MKVKNMNFKDFRGLPKKISQRIEKNEKNLSVQLPIPRPFNSSRDLHPLSLRFKKNNNNS